MTQLEKIFENKTISELVHRFSRSPQQSNRLHETDAELIAINSNKSDYLAVTIDTIADEISEGLYKDPFTMGWITVMANFSDLAAVGAEPSVGAYYPEEEWKKLADRLEPSFWGEI